jgi:hypothetical protein
LEFTDYIHALHGVVLGHGGKCEYSHQIQKLYCQSSTSLLQLARVVRKFCNVFNCSLILGSWQEKGKQQKLAQVTYIMCVCVFIKPTRMFTMSEKIKVRGWDYLDD